MIGLFVTDCAIPMDSLFLVWGGFRPADKERCKYNFRVKKDEKKFERDTIELEQIDKPKIKTKEEKEEETLENDLFDLIDSMYDNREDEE